MAIEQHLLDRFPRLTALGEESFKAIRRRLERGDSVRKTARFIRQDLAQMTEVSESAVIKNLTRLRDYDVKELVRRMRENNTLDGRTGLPSLKFSALEELTEACAVQKRRVMTAFVKREEAVGLEQGMLIEVVSKEMRLFKEMLTELAKMQMETGMLPRAPKTVSGTLTMPGATAADDPKQVAFQITEEVKTAMQVFDALVQGQPEHAEAA